MVRVVAIMLCKGLLDPHSGSHKDNAGCLPHTCADRIVICICGWSLPQENSYFPLAEPPQGGGT
jgi:hypothetical protein